jgi:hypothetical protein
MRVLGNIGNISVGFIVVMLVGCGPSPITLTPKWGESFTMAKQGQILNPEAGENLAPVEGLDGQAAQATVEAYRKSFEPDPDKSSPIPVQMQLGSGS